MYDNYVLNTGRGLQAFGPDARAMQSVAWDPGRKRPYLDQHGRRCVAVRTGKMVWNNKREVHEPEVKAYLIADLQAMGHNDPTWNATTLPRDEWIQLDKAVVKAVRPELRAWADLRAANPVGGFDAMSKMTWEYASMADVGEAHMTMDGLTPGNTDTTAFVTTSIPLPLCISEFGYSQRLLNVSRNGVAPLDTTMAEQAGFKVGRMIEDVTIGRETGPAYGTRSSGFLAHRTTSQVYGYTNFPYRVTKTDLTTPTGTNPEAVMTDVLEMMQTMQDNNFKGPYILYHSTAYSRYLNDDYFRTGSTAIHRTLRERLMDIEGITDIRRLDRLTASGGFVLILVDMRPDVAQAINGMEPTTMQWETDGGLATRFKVMACQVPLLKAPYDGVSGILHATTS